MVLRKVWKEKKIKINIFKKAAKELLYLCSRQLNFPFNSNSTNNVMKLQCATQQDLYPQASSWHH